MKSREMIILLSGFVLFFFVNPAWAGDGALDDPVGLIYTILGYGIIIALVAAAVVYVLHLLNALPSYTAYAGYIVLLSVYRLILLVVFTAVFLVIAYVIVYLIFWKNTTGLYTLGGCFLGLGVSILIFMKLPAVPGIKTIYEILTGVHEEIQNLEGKIESIGSITEIVKDAVKGRVG